MEAKQLPRNPIGIIGSGIAGIALAIALQKQGIKSVIFEKDLAFESRAQGYGLTLQQGNFWIMSKLCCRNGANRLSSGSMTNRRGQSTENTRAC